MIVIDEYKLVSLGLSGLIHVWGLPASGKTLLAVTAAASASRKGRVEWLNFDGKRGFLQQLRMTVDKYAGDPKNVAISLLEDRETMLSTIVSLPHKLHEDVVLVVIDPITRVLDMARTDPTLWGRELLEDALPALASLVVNRAIDVIVISDSRMLIDKGTVAVYHSSIKHWSNYDILVRRSASAGKSEIVLNGDTHMPQTIGVLTLAGSSGPDIVVQHPVGTTLEG